MFVDAEKLKYMLHSQRYDIELLIENVLEDSEEDPHYSAVTANNLIKCYIEIMTDLGEPLPFKDVEGFIRKIGFSEQEYLLFEEKRKKRIRILLRCTILIIDEQQKNDWSIVMTKVNIVFENDFEDADIIAIPDEIASKIETIGQEFLDWVPEASDSDYWTIIDGQKYSVAETDGFVKWLNSSYCSKTEKAYVVERNTNYCSQYKVVDF